MIENNFTYYFNVFFPLQNLKGFLKMTYLYDIRYDDIIFHQLLNKNRITARIKNNNRISIL